MKKEQIKRLKEYAETSGITNEGIQRRKDVLDLFAAYDEARTYKEKQMPNDKAPPAVAAHAPQKMQLSPVNDESEFAELLDSNRFAQIQRVANLFSESTLIPEVFQGKPANCAVALQMAFRMHVDPLMLMQNMYIVAGKPGIEAKLAIALINQRGPFQGPVQWRQEGENETRSWTAYAVHRVTGERCEATVTWAMVVAEGWNGKTGSKWRSLPDLMGRYRSAVFLGRLYCPEVLLGLPTDDELRDIGLERAVLGERLDEPENAIDKFNAGIVTVAAHAAAADVIDEVIAAKTDAPPQP